MTEFNAKVKTLRATAIGDGADGFITAAVNDCKAEKVEGVKTNMGKIKAE